jgi:cytochrome P450
MGSSMLNTPDYRAMPTYLLCERLLHHISSRVIVGERLCRDPAYMAVCRRYTMLHFISGVMWNFLPLGALRKSFYRLVSVKFRWDMNKATDYIVPEIQERMNAARTTKAEKPIDVIQFAVDQRIPTPREHDATRHAKRIIHLSFAGTGTSISLLYNLVYSVLCYPTLVPKIRNEVENAFSQFGKDSWGDKRMLNSLHILDSVIRETLRLHPAACFSAQRTAMEKLRFSDGFELEPRSRIAFATVSTNTDSDNYVNPENFDGLRFVGTAELKHNTGRTPAVTVNDKFLS